MAPTKGKQPTKGSKQIISENLTTLSFYKIMGIGTTSVYLAMTFLLFSNSFTTSYVIMLCMSTLIYIASYHFMCFAAREKYSSSGQIIDCGTDLNQEEGICEHAKDLIILTAGSQLLSLFSNYFWFLMMLAPVRALYVLWRSILAPWFFQSAPEEEPINEKKQKKLDRRRMQMM